MTSSYSTKIGVNDIGMFIGEGDCQIQFTEDEFNSLIFAQIHSQTLADAFANYCTMTFSSGSIPSCFRQDLSKSEVASVLQELPGFLANFPRALFSLMLLFEF